MVEYLGQPIFLTMKVKMISRVLRTLFVLLFPALVSCNGPAKPFTAGEFRVENKRSGFAESGTPLSKSESSPVIEAKFSGDGRFTLAQFGAEGTWTEEGRMLSIRLDKAWPVMRAMEEKSSDGTGPILMKWQIKGPDELEYYPTQLNNKRKFVMIFVRKK